MHAKRTEWICIVGRVITENDAECRSKRRDVAMGGEFVTDAFEGLMRTRDLGTPRIVHVEVRQQMDPWFKWRHHETFVAILRYPCTLAIRDQEIERPIRPGIDRSEATRGNRRRRRLQHQERELPARSRCVVLWQYTAVEYPGH